MEKEIADKILRDTEVGYDLISEKFSETRKHFWRGLEFLKDYTHAGDKVLDFGCGNGRLLELIGEVSNIKYYGTDVSEKLVEIAKNKWQQTSAELSSDSELSSGSRQFFKTNAVQTTLPFEAEFFNTTYSIAVFHHLPSKNHREQVAKELFRVTKKDGRIIVTVWNLYQKKYFKNILKNWKDKIFETLIRMSPIRSRGSRRDSGVKNLDWNDCLISFTNNKGIKFQRYHHAFTKRELKKLFENAGFVTEKCEIVGGRNILYIGKK